MVSIDTKRNEITMPSAQYRNKWFNISLLNIFSKPEGESGWDDLQSRSDRRAREVDGGCRWKSCGTSSESEHRPTRSGSAGRRKGGGEKLPGYWLAIRRTGGCARWRTTGRRSPCWTRSRWQPSCRSRRGRGRNAGARLLRPETERRKFYFFLSFFDLRTEGKKKWE